MVAKAGTRTSFDALKAEVRSVARCLWEKGWAEKNAGNLSVNVSHCYPGVSKPPAANFLAGAVREDGLAGERFLVTGTGVRFRDIAESSEGGLAVLQVARDLSGFHILSKPADKSWKPTSELHSHLMIHSLLKKAGGRDKAVLHTHPTELIALTHLRDMPKGENFTRTLWAMLPEVKMYLPGGARLAPYAKPGSQALADATCRAFQEGAEAAVWEMHGVVTVGAGLLEAFDVADVVNKAAQVYLEARSAGKPPRGLTASQLTEIEKDFPRPGPRV